MLQLPPTIRAPRPEEMPERQDIEQLLAKRLTAKIEQGFRIKLNTTPQLPYEYSADININNAVLWDLFISLSNFFPEQISVQYSLYEDELFISDNFSKAAIIEELASVKQELIQDGTLVFGLLSHTRHALIEMQVTESKYIKFWGADLASFRKVMDSFGLREMPDLEFVDDYPKVTDPLRRFVPDARPPADVIWKLDRSFNPDH